MVRSAAISAVEGSRQCAKALESKRQDESEVGADEATDAGEGHPDSEGSSDSDERHASPRKTGTTASQVGAVQRRLVAQRNNNHKVLQRLNAEILGHQRNVPWQQVFFVQYSDQKRHVLLEPPQLQAASCIGGMDERESLVHPHAPKDSFATWTFYTRSSFRTAIISLAVLLVFAFAALVFGGRLPKGIAFLAPDDFVKGFGSCYQVGMYYADPVRLPHLFKSLQPDAQACQGECAISIGCTHFTYWPDGGCLLTGPTSHLKAAPEAYARSITGPRECPEAHYAGLSQMLGMEIVSDFGISDIKLGPMVSKVLMAMETEDAAKAAAERQSQERQERRAEIDALEEAMDVHRREVEELRRLHELQQLNQLKQPDPRFEGLGWLKALQELETDLQRLRLHMERAWPEMSMADAFDWDGLLLGSVVAQPQISNAVQQPPAPPGLAPQDDLGDLGDLSDLSDEEETTTESTTPGSSEDSDDHTQLTQQRNDLRALVQVLQAQLKLSEEEANRWQREAHRQEEAATELRERIQLTQAPRRSGSLGKVWGTIGSVQAVIKAAGIGFIRPYSGPVDGKDLFFHHSELKNGNFQTLAIGDEVTYEVMMNPVKERTFAANVMLTTK
eukprot:s932_g17.t1